MSHVRSAQERMESVIAAQFVRPRSKPSRPPLWVRPSSAPVARRARARARGLAPVRAHRTNGAKGGGGWRFDAFHHWASEKTAPPCGERRCHATARVGRTEKTGVARRRWSRRPAKLPARDATIRSATYRNLRARPPWKCATRRADRVLLSTPWSGGRSEEGPRAQPCASLASLYRRLCASSNRRLPNRIAAESLSTWVARHAQNGLHRLAPLQIASWR